MWCGVMLAALSSCTEEDYKVYDTSQKDSVFFEYRDDANKLIEAIEYNFNYDIADSHTIEIPVSLMGMPKDYDRTYNIVVIDDETDMVEDVNYVISDNVIKARAVNGVVKVNLLRNLDPELLTTSKTLTLSISENDQLKSVGENKFAITYSDIRPEVRPVWWTPYATMPVYSYENAQLFFDYFYRLVPVANQAIYNEIINTYGDYFVKHKTGMVSPLVYYERFLRQYVMIPLYNEHPEIDWQASPLF